jgi:hypothetical protein
VVEANVCKHVATPLPFTATLLHIGDAPSRKVTVPALTVLAAVTFAVYVAAFDGEVEKTGLALEVIVVVVGTATVLRLIVKVKGGVDASPKVGAAHEQIKVA